MSTDETSHRPPSPAHGTLPQGVPQDYDAILPLKLDIDVDIRARLIQQGEPVDPDLLRRVLANSHTSGGPAICWRSSTGRDGRRFDLDGNRPARWTPLARARRSDYSASTRNGRKKRPPATGSHHWALEKQQRRVGNKRSPSASGEAAEKQRRREHEAQPVSRASNGGAPKARKRAGCRRPPSMKMPLP